MFKHPEFESESLNLLTSQPCANAKFACAHTNHKSLREHFFIMSNACKISAQATHKICYVKAWIPIFVKVKQNSQQIYPLPSSVISGLKISHGTGCILLRSHTSIPSALPAAMAAPKAVVSAISGLTVNKFYWCITEWESQITIPTLRIVGIPKQKT